MAHLCGGSIINEHWALSAAVSFDFFHLIK